MRQEWSRNNPERKECFKSAMTKPNPHPKWKCTQCSGEFAQSEVQCDHIDPVRNTIPKTREEFLASFERLHSSNLQILCRRCHNGKTKQDAYDKKYKDAIATIAYFFDISEEFLEHNLKEWEVIQKFEKLIKKFYCDKFLDEKELSSEHFLKKNKEMHKIYKELIKLKEKYL